MVGTGGAEPPGSVGEGPIQAEARNTSTIALAVMHDPAGVDSGAGLASGCPVPQRVHESSDCVFHDMYLLWHLCLFGPPRFAGGAGEASVRLGFPPSRRPPSPTTPEGALEFHGGVWCTGHR